MAVLNQSGFQNLAQGPIDPRQLARSAHEGTKDTLDAVLAMVRKEPVSRESVDMKTNSNPATYPFLLKYYIQRSIFW